MENLETAQNPESLVEEEITDIPVENESEPDEPSFADLQTELKLLRAEVQTIGELFAKQSKKQSAKERNERNALLSSGRVGKSSSEEYFTPDEVRKMSGSEVRANYSKIMESMKRWN